MNSRGGKRCWFKEVPALGVSVTLNSGAQTVGRDRSVGGPRGTSGPREASSNKHLFEDWKGEHCFDGQTRQILIISVVFMTRK